MNREDLQKRGKGHRQRLREKFEEGGLERFTDEEVVEFLLTIGTPRKDVKIPARQALKEFGSLSGVISASVDELKKIDGIGIKNALYLNLIHQTAGRYLRDRAAKMPYFSSAKAIFDYLFHSMRDLRREVFRVLYLNRQNELIMDQDLFLGSLTGSAVYPREVVTQALENRAAAMVFVHNHPSGNSAPSPEDKKLTRDLVFSAHLLSIQVLDHIIIGNNKYFSFADEGLIKGFVREFEQKFNQQISP